MPESSANTLLLYRDGASQAARALASLDPASAAVDERRTADWLRFLKEYARHLTYYDLDNQPQRDAGWSALFPFTDAQCDEIAAFAENPARFSDPRYDVYRRPHFALLLAFLETLRPVRDQLNRFTGRHLDFYYRDVLRLAVRSALSGRAHVVIQPRAGQGPFLLSAGTRLVAGQDASGNEIHYLTEANLVVNQTVVGECRSLFLQRRLVRLDDVRQDPEVLLRFLTQPPVWLDLPSASEKRFQALLQVALGNPNPGDPLPDYRLPANTGQPDRTVPLDRSLCRDLDRLLAFVRDALSLSLPAFRDLMALRRSQSLANPDIAAKWSDINLTLQQAGRTVRKDPAYVLNPPRPDDFIRNLKTALNLTDRAYSTLYDTLPDVSDIYGVYRRVDQPDRTDIAKFVPTTLGLPVDQFKEMMAKVEELGQPWRQILAVLRAAGRRKQRRDPNHVVSSPNLRVYDPDLWNTLVRATLGDVQANLPAVAGQPLSSLDDLDDALARLEAWFHMAAGDFAQVRSVCAKDDAKLWEWEEVFRNLTEARRHKELARRRAALLSLTGRGDASVADTLLAMVVAAVGITPPGNPQANKQLPSYAKPFFALDPVADAAYIREQLLLTPAELTELQGMVAGGRAPTRADWVHAAAILEPAQRQKEGWTPPPLVFEAWDNLHAAVDATKVTSRRATDGDASVARWRPFGDSARDDNATAPATLGFMVVSPLLALAEGTRAITLTLGFTESGYPAAGEAITAALKGPELPFRFRVSTSKGLIDIAPANVSVNPPVTPTSPALPSYPRMVRFTLRLSPQDPAVTVAPAGSGVPTTQPVLQVLLRDQSVPGKPEAPLRKAYETFRALVLARVHLHVAVVGLAEPLLQNDDAVLSPKKPFEPFGLAPVAGSRFLFAHPEISTKRLDLLAVGIEWLGAPDDLATWYANYPAQTPPIANNGSFVARLRLGDNRAGFDLIDVALFGNGGDLADKRALAGVTEPAWFGITRDKLVAKYPAYDAAPAGRLGSEPLACDRHWLLELGKPTFLHSIFPQEAARAAQSSATPKPVLNPPYTPKVKRLRLYYQASVELDPLQIGPSATDQLFHVEPFGWRRLAARPDNGGAPTWFPRYEDEGQLYLGLDRCTPPQNLSILLQLAAGSADPDLPPADVRWSYLSGDEWVALDDQGHPHLLSDTTRGLIDTGLIEFDLPPAEPGTLLPSGRYWIRASIARNSRGVCDVVNLHTQAVSAALAPGSAPAGGGVFLAPQTISRLAEPRAEVAAVLQPYSSFGGREMEADDTFRVRVSERLRHKNRALTSWDFERLVLENFPEIYKVKCLTVDSTDDPRLASTVQVIVIPDIRGKRPFDPFEPKATADTLRRIEDFLADRCVTGTRFSVQNPRYCSLKLRFSVRLQPGCNPGFYLAQLNEEVRRFLSPWAYDDSAEIVFGSRINANLIVNFVEQRPYVDYVAGMKLFLSQNGQFIDRSAEESVDLRSFVGGAPDVIIVTAPEHQIDLIAEERYVKESFVGIDYMKVELDFRVG